MDLRQFLQQHQVKFGTSGIRAKNTALTAEVCYISTLAFLRYLKQKGFLPAAGRLALAGDLRVNTEELIQVVWQALADYELSGIYLGKIPTPALSYYCGRERCPGLMITGSHIEADMNGLKFYLAEGEILKADEEEILNQSTQMPEGLFSKTGSLNKLTVSMPVATDQGYQAFLQRYLTFFPAGALQGLRLGVYLHSSVASPLLIELVEKLGATVFPFGSAAQFQSVDTEALSAYDVALAKAKIAELKLDALISTDGDGDRPLISDEFGNWLRGDLVGMLCAIILQAAYVVTPLTSNSSIDELSLFTQVIRTRVGSPYVIEAMDKLLAQGKARVLGYEANGGVLLGSSFKREGRVLSALPTRDGLLPILCLLAYLKEKQLTASALTKCYQRKFTVSSSLKNFPVDKLGWFNEVTKPVELAQKLRQFFNQSSAVKELNCSDGLRLTFEDGNIIHIRPSGNSPELRCYTEANSQDQALRLNETCLKILNQWRDQHHVETVT